MHRSTTLLTPLLPPPDLRATGPSTTSLGSAIAADLEALRNDVEMARILAAEYQSQLAGKSNEVADLKQVFERTQKDLALLQDGISNLREERHKLANEAMRAMAFERKLKLMTEERDILAREVENLRRLRTDGDEARFTGLELEIEDLRRQLAEARRATPGPVTPGPTAKAPPATAPEREVIEMSFHETSPMPAVTHVPEPKEGRSTRGRQHPGPREVK